MLVRSSLPRVGAPPLGWVPCACWLTAFSWSAESVGKPFGNGKLKGLPLIIPLASADDPDEPDGAARAGAPVEDEPEDQLFQGFSAGTGTAETKPRIDAPTAKVLAENMIYCTVIVSECVKERELISSTVLL